MLKHSGPSKPSHATLSGSSRERRSPPTSKPTAWQRRASWLAGEWAVGHFSPRFSPNLLEHTFALYVERLSGVKKLGEQWPTPHSPAHGQLLTRPPSPPGWSSGSPRAPERAARAVARQAHLAFVSMPRCSKCQKVLRVFHSAL